MLIEAPVLTQPTQGKENTMYSDASRNGLGCVVAPFFFGPTLLVGPNRIRDALIPLNHFIKILYQIHVEAFSFSNLCGSGFILGQAHKHLQIQ